MVEEESSVMSNQVDDGGIPMNKIFQKYGCINKRNRNYSKKKQRKLKINDITLYQRAFAHKSYAKKKKKEGDLPSDSSSDEESKEESNERLEFADSVLSAIVANYLFDRFQTR